MYNCIECGNPTEEKKRRFVGCDWCPKCIDKETKRSIKQDTTGSIGEYQCIRSRPPKYMLKPQEYKRFGY